MLNKQLNNQLNILQVYIWNSLLNANVSNVMSEILTEKVQDCFSTNEVFKPEKINNSIMELSYLFFISLTLFHCLKIGVKFDVLCMFMKQ